jgi:threonine synthase
MVLRRAHTAADNAGSGISRDEIDGRTRSLWRYRAVLPVDIAKPISLGEGCTPLVQQSWGDLRPHFKLEWFNPTGSFKDRGSAVLLSFLRQIGVDAILEDSSGNGGSSMAGLGAAGGMRVKILAPASTSPAKIAQVRAYGAEIQLVEGPREESEAEAIRQSNETFYASHNWQPFFLEGTKSLAYELWEDLGFRAPDNVVIPVGAGSSLLGCAFGFRELMKAGQIAKLPRLFVTQPLNCSPIDASSRPAWTRPCSERCAKPSPKVRLSNIRCACARSSARCARAAAAQLPLRKMKSSPRCADSRDRVCSPNPLAPALRPRWTSCPTPDRSKRTKPRSCFSPVTA